MEQQLNEVRSCSSNLVQELGIQLKESNARINNYNIATSQANGNVAQMQQSNTQMATQLERIKAEINNLNQQITQSSESKNSGHVSTKERLLESYDNLSTIQKDNKKLKEEVQR